MATSESNESTTLSDGVRGLNMGESLLHACQTPGCGKPASFRCPTCSKFGIIDSYFCSQACFKGAWPIHKLVHHLLKSAPPPDETNSNGIDGPLDNWPDFTFTGTVRPFRKTPRRTVPSSIGRPDYAEHLLGRSLIEENAKETDRSIVALNEEEQEIARLVGRLGREVLDACAQAVAPGVTTDELDRIAHEACIERECYPSPLNYYNFPKSCCTSVNEVICHGIPDMRPLCDGDIVNVDISVYHRGFHSDLNETLFVGKVDDPDSRRVVTCAYECLQKAIAIVKPGVRYREVGDVIQKHAQSLGCSVVRTYCGHGCNRLFHAPPSIPHYAKNKAIGTMRVGHVFTIEPMINLGVWQDITWPDNWTSVTRDGKRSAQFEHSLLVTDAGCEVLTRNAGDDQRPWFQRQTH